MTDNNDIYTERIDGDNHQREDLESSSTVLKRGVYPAEKAYGLPRKTPAWERMDPGLSGRYLEIHSACDAIAGLLPEVTSP